MADVNKTIGFVITGIATEQFATIDEAYKETVAVNLNTNIRFTLDHERRGVSCFTLFQFTQKHIPFLKIEVGCHFVVKPESWREFVRTNFSILIPKAFITHLGMITVGTSRGILHAKTEGTRFSRFIIPTINVSDMINSDVAFNPSSQKVTWE